MSSTKRKSRVVVVAPSSITSRVSACVMIVGITARALCRGPKVLNGRATTTGVPNDRWYESAIWSAPTFVAA